MDKFNIEAHFHNFDFDTSSEQEIAAKAFDSSKDTVNKKTPLSSSENSSSEGKSNEGAKVASLFIETIVSPNLAMAASLGNALENVQGANLHAIPQIPTMQEQKDEKKSISIEAPTKSVQQAAAAPLTLENNSVKPTKKVAMKSLNLFSKDKAEKKAPAAAPGAASVESKKKKYKTEEIEGWLFNKAEKPDDSFPSSKIGPRRQNDYKPEMNFSNVPMLGNGKYTSRIGICKGKVTDIYADKKKKGVIADTNNGDLLTGCGAFTATAVINAAGAKLQRDLYNEFGVQLAMGTPKKKLQQKYRETEYRGYSLMRKPYDMEKTHNIKRIEFMVVPALNIKGVENMYAEAFEHNKKMDFIVMPAAGTSHLVFHEKLELCAETAMEAFKKFVDENPGSQLIVIFTVSESELNTYKKAAEKLDKSTQK